MSIVWQPQPPPQSRAHHHESHTVLDGRLAWRRLSRRRDRESPTVTSTNQSAVNESEKSQDEKAIQAATAASSRPTTPATPRRSRRSSPRTPRASTRTEPWCKEDRRSRSPSPRRSPPAPAARWRSAIDSLRFLSPDVAKEEGRCTITPAGAGGPDVDRYTVLYVKKDGKWLQTSVREHPDLDRARMSGSRSWSGSWANGLMKAMRPSSSPPAGGRRTRTSCSGTYTFQIQGRPAMTGTQRIGWDPVTGQFKSWVFDSQGGQSEGLWSRDGDRWVIKLSGPLRGGKISTETNIITRVNNDMAGAGSRSTARSRATSFPIVLNLFSSGNPLLPQ